MKVGRKKEICRLKQIIPKKAYFTVETAIEQGFSLNFLVTVSP